MTDGTTSGIVIWIAKHWLSIMKNKALALALLLVIFAPHVVSAAWWNPFSWFLKESTSSQNTASTNVSNQAIEQTTTFYFKTDNVRVRACPSTSCNIMGYFKTNDWVKVSESVGTNLESLPEWIEINIPDTGIGYVSKSLLSSKPISAEEITEKNNIANQASLSSGLRIVKDWIGMIDTEIQSTRSMRDVQESRSANYYTEEVVDTLNGYISDITEIRKQLNNILSTIKSRSDLNTQVPRIDSLTSRFDRLKSQLSSNIEVAIDEANIRARNDSNARQRASSDSYRRAQAELDAVNQARIDASNAYVERYNSIRQQGAINGATEAVVNAQLNAAGLIKQTTCSFSAAGGMTPGAGSMVCY